MRWSDAYPVDPSNGAGTAARSWGQQATGTERPSGPGEPGLSSRGEAPAPYVAWNPPAFRPASQVAELPSRPIDAAPAAAHGVVTSAEIPVVEGVAPGESRVAGVVAPSVGRVTGVVAPGESRVDGEVAPREPEPWGGSQDGDADDAPVPVAAIGVGFGERIERLIAAAVTEADNTRADAAAEAEHLVQTATLEAQHLVAAAQRQAAEIVAAAQRRMDDELAAAQRTRQEAEQELAEARQEADHVRRRARAETTQLRAEIDQHAQAILARTHADANRTLSSARAELEEIAARKADLENQMTSIRTLLADAVAAPLPQEVSGFLGNAASTPARGRRWQEAPGAAEVEGQGPSADDAGVAEQPGESVAGDTGAAEDADAGAAADEGPEGQEAGEQSDVTAAEVVMGEGSTEPAHA